MKMLQEKRSMWLNYCLHISLYNIFVMVALAGTLMVYFLSYPQYQKIDVRLSPECKKQNLMFIKTHKCGTSTLVNTFYLYGVRRRLNFVIHEPELTWNDALKTKHKLYLHTRRLYCCCLTILTCYVITDFLFSE